jgi:transcriptional regulator with XRE-family HTH domain
MISQNAGEIVELAIRRKNINISELSRKMKVNRRTLYNWFQQETLTSSVIYLISQAIDYDFSEEFPKYFFEKKMQLQTPLQEANTNDTEASQYYWMKKYITLLEEYRLLLEKFNKTQVSEDQQFYRYF